MSSIAIVQEHDRFTYVVDTAQSCVIDNQIYRIQDVEVKKVYRIGKDMVFLSGSEPSLEKIRFKMQELLEDGHINTEYLQGYLRREFQPINDINSREINGFVIMSIIDGETAITAMKQSYNHFEIIRLEAPPEGEIKLVTDGFEHELFWDRINENEADCFKRTGSYSILENILKAYRGHYSEGVGGKLLMCRFDVNGVTHLHTEMLEENGLRCVHKGINRINDNTYIVDRGITRININGHIPIHGGNIGAQEVAFATSAGKATNADYASSAAYATGADTATSAVNASYASQAGSAGSAGSLHRGGIGGSVYVSINNNFRPTNDASDNDWSSCGTSDGRWSSVWALNGSIITSDEREKTEIIPLEEDARFIQFAKMIAPYSFKMLQGTSGRKHIGFIAQRIEEAMAECGISSMEFAGLIKAPVYAEKLKDEDGNEIDEYDTSSEIVDYSYHLRYEEFIPLLFLWMRSLSFD